MSRRFRDLHALGCRRTDGDTGNPARVRAGRNKRSEEEEHDERKKATAGH